MGDCALFLACASLARLKPLAADHGTTARVCGAMPSMSSQSRVAAMAQLACVSGDAFRVDVGTPRLPMHVASRGLARLSVVPFFSPFSRDGSRSTVSRGPEKLWGGFRFLFGGCLRN